MERRIKRILKLFAGWVCILFGIVGLFVPILKGVLFLFVGLVLLSSEYVWADRLLSKIRNRFPSLTARLDKAVATIQAWFGRVFNRSGSPTK
jgi:uncharacterized protein